MKISSIGLSLFAGVFLMLGGCAHQMEPIPKATAAIGNPEEGRALLALCVQAHGGRAAYEKLRDVNVRYEGHWASLGPRLQPKLSDTGYRGGSEERYLIAKSGFIVGQHHHGPKGNKWVSYSPGGEVAVGYRSYLREGVDARSTDPEVRAAAALVIDAYSSFLFGPYFFEKRGASVQKLASEIVIDGRPCERLLAILRPGLGKSPEDRMVLCIDRQDHLLRRVQFTLNGLESTQGAEVHVDLMDHRRMASVWWPTAFYEHIERPVNLPAHRWRMTGFDAGRGYAAGDLVLGARTGFGNRAETPARKIAVTR